jgi:hypothetical protein
MMIEHKKHHVIFNCCVFGLLACILVWNIVLSVQVGKIHTNNKNWTEIKSITYTDGNSAKTINSTFALSYGDPILITQQEYNDFPTDKKMLYNMFPRGEKFPLYPDKSIPFQNNIIGEFFAVGDDGLYCKMQVLNIDIIYVYIKIINSNEISIKYGNTQKTICSNFFEIEYFE